MVPRGTLLMELAHLYGLDFQLIAQWAGYLDEEAGRHASGELIGLVLRMFAGLGPGGQSAAISYLQELRLGHGRE